MVLFNRTILDAFFGTNKPSSSTSKTKVTIIRGVALSDSEDGEVKVQIGDPVEILDEENDGFVEVYLDDDDTVDNYNEDVLASEPGEDDIFVEELDETGIVYIGNDEESDESDEVPPDNEDESGELIEEVTE